MSYHYSDPSRENDTCALPDVEVFHVYAGEWTVCDYCGERNEHEYCDHCTASDAVCEPCKAGYYYWFCFPGCMPEGEPHGPYETEAAAVAAMREEVDT